VSFEIETLIIDPEITKVTPYQEAMFHVRNGKLLGYGIHGCVYEDPDNPERAIKVARASDIGYFMFLKLLQKFGDGNRYLPKIYKVVHYRYPDKFVGHDPYYLRGHSNKEYYVVWMEKLSKGRQIPSMGDRPIRSAKKEDFPSRVVYGKEYFAFKLKTLFKKYENIDYSRFNKHHHDFLALLQLLREIADAKAMDFHEGNVMFRGRQIVVIDPISFVGEKHKLKVLQ